MSTMISDRLAQAALGRNVPSRKRHTTAGQLTSLDLEHHIEFEGQRKRIIGSLYSVGTFVDGKIRMRVVIAKDLSMYYCVVAADTKVEVR